MSDPVSEQDTLELFPEEPAPQPAAEPAESAAAAKKRRPRWWLRAILALLLVAVLAVAAEFALRAIIPNVIANAVRENMGLPGTHPVKVELSGSSLLPALTGHVGEVEVTVPRVEVFDGIETTLFASAESVPFDPTKGDIVGATASATIPSSSMDALMKLATDGLVDEGEVRDGELELGRTMQIFGFDVHLTVGLAVSVQHGDLLVEPTSINAAGFNLTTEQLRPMLGDSAVALLETHTVCVRDRIPAGITLTDVELTTTALGGSAKVTASLDPDILSNPEQQQLGSCEAEQ